MFKINWLDCWFYSEWLWGKEEKPGVNCAGDDKFRGKWLR